MFAHASNVRSVCACVVIAPFGFPVVPDVKMMSDDVVGPHGVGARACRLGVDLVGAGEEVGERRRAVGRVALQHDDVLERSGSGPASRSMAT